MTWRELLSASIPAAPILLMAALAFLRRRLAAEQAELSRVLKDHNG